MGEKSNQLSGSQTLNLTIDVDSEDTQLGLKFLFNVAQVLWKGWGGGEGGGRRHHAKGRTCLSHQYTNDITLMTSLPMTSHWRSLFFISNPRHS